MHDLGLSSRCRLWPRAEVKGAWHVSHVDMVLLELLTEDAESWPLLEPHFVFLSYTMRNLEGHAPEGPPAAPPLRLPSPGLLPLPTPFPLVLSLFFLSLFPLFHLPYDCHLVSQQPREYLRMRITRRFPYGA